MDIREKALFNAADIPVAVAQYLRHLVNNKAGGVVMTLDVFKDGAIPKDSMRAMEQSAAQLIASILELTDPVLGKQGKTLAQVWGGPLPDLAPITRVLAPAPDGEELADAYPLGMDSDGDRDNQ